jgi:hypothetical protein
MITIDTIEDNNERSARPAAQAAPAEIYRQHASYDAAYDSARSFYTDLLHTAQRERQVRQAISHASIDPQRKHQALIALSRIARALAAWL